ncbi:MAG: thermonuclease family protein [Oscillatoria princeps RMCB-10]|nr:thermonuclease family protein [Oscillatoria princeps RMCB-10]
MDTHRKLPQTPPPRWRGGGWGVGFFIRRMSKAGCLLFILCLLLASCAAPAAPRGVTVSVERVVSGQMLQIAGNPLQQVRLIGIEAPDFKQHPWGLEAKKRLEAMIDSQPVLLEFDVEEKFCYNSRCRQLAYVWREGKLLNEELVKQGYALAEPRSPNVKYTERLARAQEWARLMGEGIWNPDSPMRLPPADFRRQSR